MPGKEKGTLDEVLHATKWRPGQSGNPGGRPKGEGGELARRVWREPVPKYLLAKLNAGQGHCFPDGTTFGEVVILRTYLSAMTGNIEAVKLLFNRVDGVMPKNYNLDVAGQIEHVEISEVRRSLINFFHNRNSQDGSQLPPSETAALPAHESQNENCNPNYILDVSASPEHEPAEKTT